MYRPKISLRRVDRIKMPATLRDLGKEIRRLSPCIAIDWLQCHVQVPRKDFERLFEYMQSQAVSDGVGGFTIQKVANKELQELDNRYQLAKTTFQTRNFKSIYEIKDRKTGEDIAVLAAEPRSEQFMKQDSGLIKIINKYLYQKNFTRFARGLLNDLQLRFINITRLDIAYDFLKFDTMECAEFICRFANKTYLKKYQSKFKLMGDSWSVDKGQLTGGYSSLKFGLETSDVNYYLYNKTLELQQVKDKPWIRDHWIANGWDEKSDVWRLQFSLHPDTNGIAVVKLNEDTGEVTIDTVYHFKDFGMLDHVDHIFEHYFNRHFNFVRTSRTKKGNYRKQSRCKPVTLFKHLTFEGVKITLSDKKDSGRSAKIFAKKLMELNNELRGRDFDLAIAGNELLTLVIKTHDLEAWQRKKLPNIELSPRVVDMVNASRASGHAMEVMKYSGMPAIYPSFEAQGAALRDVENTIKQNNFEIVPDGKIPMYDGEGKQIGYVDPIF